jgi:hypothetical protein
LDNGVREKNVVRGNNTFKMVLFMKVIGTKILLMEKEE